MNPTFGRCPQRCGSGSESFPSGLKGRFQNRPVLGFGAATMRQRTSLEGVDQVTGHISDKKLRHLYVLSHDSIIATFI